MNISIKNIIVLIFTSSIIGLAYNYMNPQGIPFIKTERVLQFEDENSNPNDSIAIPHNIDRNNDNLAEEEYSESKPPSEDAINELQSTFEQPVAIKLTRAYELFNDGARFIDARPKEEFAEGHIRNAINIPFYQSEQYEEQLNKISKEEILVTYCSGEDCDLSIMLGDELFEKGYKNIYIFYGGWNDWLDAGYPVVNNY